MTLATLGWVVLFFVVVVGLIYLGLYLVGKALEKYLERHDIG